MVIFFMNMNFPVTDWNTKVVKCHCTIKEPTQPFSLNLQKYTVEFGEP